MKTKYWVMKSEPREYSISDLYCDKKTAWTGVRNYQARNMIRDDIKINDRALFYHSNSPEIGVVGEMEVISKPYPDPTQFDKKDNHHDPKSTREDPRWFCIDVSFVAKNKKIVPLEIIKNDKICADMILIKKGNRLSITPLTKEQFDHILSLGR